MANNDYNDYLAQVAQMRLHRAQQEHSERVQNTISDYQQAVKERDDAAARQDWETFQLADRDCEQLEKDWQYLNPRQQPQFDPRLVNFVKRNSSFFEKYGQRALAAVNEAHNYMLRRKNPNTDDPRYTGMSWNPQYLYTPQYFSKLKDLMEIHGETFAGVSMTGTNRL
jgi:hypothetical protein